MTRYKKIGGEKVPFSAEEEIARDAEEAAWAAGAVERLEAIQLKEAKKKERTDNLLANLTFDQAESWIETNVTNIASAKTALKHLARLLIALK